MVVGFLSRSSASFCTIKYPSVEQTLPAMPLLLIFMVLFILPGPFACIWGPKFLSPGQVGLLLMTEVVTGSFSVASLLEEPFGPREIIGVILITSSSILEPFIGLGSRAKFAGRN